MKKYLLRHKKLLLTSTLFFVAFVSVGIVFVDRYIENRYKIQSIKNEETPSYFAPKEAIRGEADNIKIENIKQDELLTETNKMRSENSSSTLLLNDQLNKSAQLKCEDMVSKNYWSHVSPTGEEPWVFFDNAKYTYSKAGENLAFGYWNASSVVNGWMLSPEHKKNLLDSSYEEVGFGVCESSNFADNGQEVVVVQHFGTKIKSSSKSSISPTPSFEYKPYVASVCTKNPIPRGTDIKYVSYLYEDEEQRYTGWDGYTNICTADSTGYKPADYTSPPYNDTLYKGTKVRDSRNYSAKYICDSEYSSAKSQLQIAGAGDSSAMLQVEQLYAQCLSRAGF